jgi:hypothetical protein
MTGFYEVLVFMTGFYGVFVFISGVCIANIQCTHIFIP